MSKEVLEQIGESEIANVTNPWQLVAMLALKYGLQGVVLMFLGFMLYTNNHQIITMMERSITAIEQNAAATNRLTEALKVELKK